MKLKLPAGAMPALLLLLGMLCLACQVKAEETTPAPAAVETGNAAAGDQVSGIMF